MDFFLGTSWVVYLCFGFYMAEKCAYILPRQLNTAKDLRGFLAHTKEVTSPLAHKASKTTLTRV